MDWYGRRVYAMALANVMIQRPEMAPAALAALEDAAEERAGRRPEPADRTGERSASPRPNAEAERHHRRSADGSRRRTHNSPRIMGGCWRNSTGWTTRWRSSPPVRTSSPDAGTGWWTCPLPRGRLAEAGQDPAAGRVRTTRLTPCCAPRPCCPTAGEGTKHWPSCAGSWPRRRTPLARTDPGGADPDRRGPPRRGRAEAPPPAARRSGEPGSAARRGLGPGRPGAGRRRRRPRVSEPRVGGR
jgi:hypothetical protein